MIILWIVLPMLVISLIFTNISKYKRNYYLKTTKLYLKNTLFFRLQNEALGNAHLDNDNLKQRLSCIIEKSLEYDQNLEYKILITSNKNKKCIKVNISNGIHKPFNSINQNFIIDLSEN